MGSSSPLRLRSERPARAHVPEVQVELYRNLYLHVEHAELGLSRVLHGRLVRAEATGLYCEVHRIWRGAGAEMPNLEDLSSVLPPSIVAVQGGVQV